MSRLGTGWGNGGASGEPILPLAWGLGDAMEPDWQAVDGEPGVRCRFQAVYGADPDFGLITAMPAVNAISAVVAARPGLVTAADLPLIVAAHGLRGGS